MKFEKIIRALREASPEVQLYLIEEFENLIREEEQRKLSQNLHDEFAGTLAAIKNNVELAFIKATEQNQKKDLEKIRDLIHDVFVQIRDKSHRLYSVGSFFNTEVFCRHIQDMVQVMLPSPPYIVNIHIDHDVIEKIPLELRSELILIIKESFTNIIKHTEAVHVDLLLYRENSQLIIIIKNDGRVKSKEIDDKKSLGIDNIKNRLQRFGGFFMLQNEGTKFEVIISIPDTVLEDLDTL